jgi:hypothetical protein
LYKGTLDCAKAAVTNKPSKATKKKYFMLKEFRVKTKMQT